LRRFAEGSQIRAGFFAVWRILAGDLLGQTQYPITHAGDGTLGDPGTGSNYTVTRKYNAVGDAITMTDRNGNTHAYAFDALGRPTSDSVTTLGSGVDGNTRRYDTSYDTGGRVERVTGYADTGGATVRNQVWNVYNGLGQLTKQYQEHGGLATTNSASVQYAYSEMSGGGNHSRLISMTYPNGRVINYDYEGMLGVDDTISRVSRISETTNHTTIEGYSYLGLSTIVEQDRPQNGTKLSLVQQSNDTLHGTDGGDQYTGLDRFGRVVDQWWLKYSGTNITGTLDRFQYAYDPNSNVLYKNVVGNGTVAATFSELYHANGTSGAYDALNRLTDFSRGTLSAVGGSLLNTVATSNTSISGIAGTQSTSLDTLGNTSTLNTDGTAQTRTADNQNELLTLQNGTNTAVSLTYDNNGNLLTDEAGQSYVYDPWNRLHSVSNSNVTRTFSYDGLHRGAVSIEDTSSSTSIRELYYSNDWQVIEEREDAWRSSSPLEQNIWGLGYVDNLVRRDRYYDPSNNHDFSPVEHLWAQQDANDNVTSIADDTGTVKLRLVYDPYGKFATLDSNWSATTDSYEWKYTHQGLRTYSDVGLIDNRERYYRPTLQRFVQQDPIGYTDGANLYQYQSSSPINLTDPNGLYGRRVHRDDTYNLARAAGFDHATANRIADCDQGMDEHGNDAITNGIISFVTLGLANLWPGHSDRYAHHHPGAGPFINPIFAQRPVKEGFDNKDVWKFLNNAMDHCDPCELGKALHALQDSYSHGGTVTDNQFNPIRDRDGNPIVVPPDKGGHPQGRQLFGPGGQVIGESAGLFDDRVDNPDLDPARYQAALRDTQLALAAFRNECRCKGH
jgi:RHS repeat-associated protein